MSLNPYLTFNGTCEAAFNFYADVTGGTIDFMMRNSDSPQANDMPTELQNKIMHAQMRIGESLLMGADVSPDSFQPAQGISLQFGFELAHEAEKVFTALSQGGQVTLPIEETFWAERFGMLIDRFGIPWIINGGSKG